MAKAASHRLNDSADSTSGSCSTLLYQARVNPFGGNVTNSVSETDKEIVTSKGAAMKIRVAAVTV